VSYKSSLTRTLGVLNHICQGRLTLTSGTPVTTSDVTGATSIYWTPYNGNLVSLYDGTRWRMYAFTEMTLALGTLTSGLPYDVFLYDNAGTLTLEATAWTNGTTRATALTTQDGVYVKTGATTRRYLGTFYTTSTTETEDSFAKRFLWNCYNQKKRKLRKFETNTSWSYGTAAWRSANNSTTNRVEVIIGLSETPISLTLNHMGPNGTSTLDNSIGLDSTSTPHADVGGAYGGYIGTGTPILIGTLCLQVYPGVGYHYLQWLEFSSSAGQTSYGYDSTNKRWQCGLTGDIVC